MPSTKAASEPREITKAEITEVLELHRGILRMTLVRQIQIGEKLVGMKERVPKGKWGRFLDENFSEISSNSCNRYMRLFENKEVIEKKFKIKFAGLEKAKDIPWNFPTSIAVDAYLRERDQNLARGSSVTEKRKEAINGTASAKGNGSGQQEKGAKNGLQVVQKYTLETFAKELGELWKKARQEGIPVAVICDTVGAVYAELQKMLKPKSTKVKPA